MLFTRGCDFRLELFDLRLEGANLMLQVLSGLHDECHVALVDALHLGDVLIQDEFLALQSREAKLRLKNSSTEGALRSRHRWSKCRKSWRFINRAMSHCCPCCV